MCGVCKSDVKCGVWRSEVAWEVINHRREALGGSFSGHKMDFYSLFLGSSSFALPYDVLLLTAVAAWPDRGLRGVRCGCEPRVVYSSLWCRSACIAATMMIGVQKIAASASASLMIVAMCVKCSPVR